MKRVIVSQIGEENAIAEAVKVLQAGGLVVYPTETTYGIGADATNQNAIDTLLAYKGKRDGKALSVAVPSMEQAQHYVSLNETAKTLYAQFLPGPVTIISRSTGIVSQGVESLDGTIGIRIPAYEFTLQLLRTYGKGITATGANASYKKRPYSVDDILESISDKQKELIDLILDVGELPHNEPSTVIDTTLDDVKVLRSGKLNFKSTETIDSSSVEQTLQIAQNLIKQYRSYLTYEPLIITLEGEMGAGKTHFAKGLAMGLGITDLITSPTYTLSIDYSFVNEERTAPFIHVDTWRMNDVREFEALGVDQWLSHNAVIAVEWGDRIAASLEELQKSYKVIRVQLQTVTEQSRRITISHS